MEGEGQGGRGSTELAEVQRGFFVSFGSHLRRRTGMRRVSQAGALTIIFRDRIDGFGAREISFGAFKIVAGAPEFISGDRGIVFVVPRMVAGAMEIIFGDPKTIFAASSIVAGWVLIANASRQGRFYRRAHRRAGEGETGQL